MIDIASDLAVAREFAARMVTWGLCPGCENWQLDAAQGESPYVIEAIIRDHARDECMVLDAMVIQMMLGSLIQPTSHTEVLDHRHDWIRKQVGRDTWLRCSSCAARQEIS